MVGVPFPPCASWSWAWAWASPRGPPGPCRCRCPPGPCPHQTGPPRSHQRSGGSTRKRQKGEKPPRCSILLKTAKSP
eukprot:222953-Alexandrium_andersonii.AAC.1